MARGPSPRAEAGRRAPPAPDPASPWLEEAEHDGSGGTLIGRSTLWIILLTLLLLVSLVAAGVFMVARRGSADIDAPPPGTDIPVLRDPGPWKVAPSGPGIEGRPVEGIDQMLFETGDGRDRDARIALEKLPEDPAIIGGAPAEGAPTDLLPGEAEDAADADAMAATAGQPGRPAPSAGTGRPAAEQTVTPRPADGPAARPAVAARVIALPAAPEGTVLQLGAFSAEARTRTAWKALSERFPYLEGLAPMIVPVAQDGRTLYRLRTVAPDPATARDICQKLKVAGETCAIVS